MNMWTNEHDWLYSLKCLQCFGYKSEKDQISLTRSQILIKYYACKLDNLIATLLMLYKMNVGEVQ